MEDSIRKQIIGIRSKYCEPILELLSREGELYHGDLAEKMNMSPSGLNVIIKKMQECTPPILEINQIGKYKIYALPPAVKEYMEAKRGEGKAFAPEDSFREDAGEENLLLCMQHFVEKAGDKWRERFNLLLQGEEDEAQEIKSEFERLMGLIREASKYREEEFERLNRFLNNDVLKYLVREYLDETEQCEEILRQVRNGENGERLARHFIIK